jgi:DMSO/TMAO reductase YedYZ molybdopterin-dependent catalytic subunit
MAFSLADLKGLPARSQITHLACEEGWSYIAEWTGVPLRLVLERAGILPQAKFIVYTSLEPYWSDSIDMADALHPQTLLAYGMNGGELPHGHGGPLRLRVPRQLAYKSVKYIHRLHVTDRREVAWTGGGYAWYAGI